MQLKGIYIEDDDKNIVVTQLLFQQEGFEIIPLSDLPGDPKDLYPMILKHEADFLLIDHQLNKKVGYSGYDALQEIRKNDSTIYAVLLTTYDVEDYKPEFGIYDLEVKKSELDTDEKLSEVSQKIRRACARASESEILASADASLKFAEESLSILRKIHDSVSKNS